MADQKISAMTAASALSGTELIETVQGGANKKTTAQDIANLASGAEHYRGDWSDSSLFPTTGGSGTAGDVSAGDRWRITVDATYGGNFYPAGTIIESAIDTPGQTRANWNMIPQML